MALGSTVVLIGIMTALSLGQLLFKESARRLPGVPFPELISKLLTIPYFWLSLLLYGGATFAWVWILSRLPLHVAYPFYALTFILVPLLAWLVLGERIAPNYWLGMVLILVGVVVGVRQ